MALGPLAVVDALFVPSTPAWLPVASAGIGLLIAAATVTAQWVRLVARLWRFIGVVLAVVLLAIASGVLVNMMSWPWLVWPTLAAGLIVLFASAFESNRPLRARES